MDTSIIDPTKLRWYDNPVDPTLQRRSETILLHASEILEISAHFDEVGPGQYMPFGHIERYGSGKRYFEEIAEVWPPIRKRFAGPFFVMGTYDTPAFGKLVEKHGFKLFRTIPCSDGETRRLFVHYG